MESCTFGAVENQSDRAYEHLKPQDILTSTRKVQKGRMQDLIDDVMRVMLFEVFLVDFA